MLIYKTFRGSHMFEAVLYACGVPPTSKTSQNGRSPRGRGYLGKHCRSGMLHETVERSQWTMLNARVHAGIVRYWIICSYIVRRLVGRD